MIKRRLLLAATLVCSCLLAACEVLGADQDTTISQAAPNTNYGTDETLRVGNRQQRSALLRFESPEQVPDNLIILDADLQIYAVAGLGDQVTVGAYPLLRGFNPNEATWNQARIGVPWGQPGCNDTATDRESKPADTQTIDAFSDWYLFDVTALVQQWASGDLGYEGILLMQSKPSDGYVLFASSDYADTVRRPALVIWAATPTPGATMAATRTPTTTTTATRTPTTIATLSPSNTATHSPVLTATDTPTETVTCTSTFPPTEAPSQTVTRTATPSPSPTRSATPGRRSMYLPIARRQPTPTSTPSPSPTRSPTLRPTSTPGSSSSPTRPPAGYDWSLVQTGTAANLLAVHFVSPETGWILTDDTLLHTTDGGASWQTQVHGAPKTPLDLFFVDENQGWIVGVGALIMRTTDGGNTWQLQTSPVHQDYNFRTVQFVGSNRGWIAATYLWLDPNPPINMRYYGHVLRTVNGGESWESAAYFSTCSVKDLHFVDENQGWFLSTSFDSWRMEWEDTVYRTSNGGTSWARDWWAGTEASMRDIFLVDARNGWIVGDDEWGDGPVWRSRDGSGWTSATAIRGDLTGVQFAGSLEGWIHSRREILHTADGGSTWNLQSLEPGCTNFTGFHINDAQHGWIVGDSGVACKYR